MINRLVSLLRLASLMLCAACLTPSTRAATLNVPAQYATIQAAVTTANTGDTILVADGTYTGAGNYNVDFGSKDLMVQSVSGNPANCVIDCQKAGCAFILQNNQTASSLIAGFTIKNGTGYINKSGGGIYVSFRNLHPVVSNCVFTGNSAQYGGGMYNSTATNCVFTGNSAYTGGGMYSSTAINCIFTSNLANSNGGGIYSSTATNCVFTGNSAQYGGGMCYGRATNCVFTGNTATMGNVGGGSGGGMYGSGASGTYLSIATNCVFINNYASQTGGGVDGADLYFCSIVNNHATYGCGIFLYSSTVSNCIVWGNTGGNSSNISGSGAVGSSDVQGGFTGNINADPLFVNQAAGNLHLTAGSPCIDAASPSNYFAGGNIFLPPTTDGDGGKRTIGAKPDMGAYEYGNVGVFGTLTFDGISTIAPAQNVTLQFRPVSGAAINTTYFTTSDGAFYLYGVPNGKYNLWVKSPTYLAAVVPVTVTGGAVSGITATLEPGDSDNDNYVGPSDFNIFVSAYNSDSKIPGTGYDARADLNGDGIVDPTDFGLFVGSYNTQGAP